MAFPKVEQDVVVEKLTELFRAVGYDGATLARIAEATGLQKASLYHRFPGGKHEMAQVVLDLTETWVTDNLTAALSGGGSPAERLDQALLIIDALYAGGQKNCVLRALSAGSETTRLQPQISRIFAGWITGFERLGLELGLSEERAAKLARETLVQVQGSLVVGMAMEQPGLFQEALAKIRAAYRTL